MLLALLERFLGAYASIVARHRKWFLILSILGFLLLTSGWYKFRMENDIRYLFTPSTSPIKYNTVKVAEYFRLNTADTKYILMFAKQTPDSEPGDGNVLAIENARNIRDIIRHIGHNLTVEHEGKNYHYYPDMVRTDAPAYRINQIITGLMSSFADNSTELKSKAVRMHYPMGELLGQPFYLPFVFGGVKVNPDTNNVASARGMVLYFAVDQINETMLAVSKKFEAEMWKYALNTSAHPLIEMSVYTWDSMLFEVRKNTFHTLAYVPGAFLLTMAFTVFCCSSFALSTNLMFHAGAALISVGMSYMAGMGLLFHLGFSYNDLVSVTSFLALAIGVDNSFVILDGWRRHLHVENQEERLQAMMKEAGASIIFTSMTDCVAFAVGMNMDVPALRDFCVFAAMAIFCDFFFQHTFFPAAILYCDTIKEKHDRIVEKVVKKVFSKQALQSPLASKFFSSNNTPEDSRSWVAKFCFVIVSSRIGQTFLAILIIALTAVAVMGTARLKPDSSLTKVMVDDSEFYDNAVKFEKLFWSEGTLFSFVVNAPNFTDPASLDRFEKFVTQLEGIKMSVGRESTQLWVRDFVDYSKDWDVQPEDISREVITFLEGRADVTQHMTYRTEVLAGNKTVQVPTRFHFFTAYYGSADWNVRGDIVQAIIEVTEEYPELHAIFYHEMVECVDLMNYTRYSLKQTLGQSLFAIMLLMSILFLSSLDVSQLFPVIWVAASFIAINAMVVGYLCLWGVDMDVVAMICLLMTVGFSVDYTVHMAVTYARQTVVEGVSSRERVRIALDEVARPILNSGLSTLIAVGLVSLVQSYMLRTFVKSVLLVVVFGQLQSLLVLPACFILLDDRGRDVAQVRKRRLRTEDKEKNVETNVVHAVKNG